MAYYRLYLLNEQSGRIERVEEIEAPDDASAIGDAMECRAERRRELWCRARRVTSLEPFQASFVLNVAAE